MTEYWTGILGGLIGSILTVAITKLLDILQKSKEHQYNLERSFFEKKLLAAEATITQYTILSNALTNLAVVYERLNNETNEVEDYLQNTLHQQAMQQLEVANNASFIVANSVTLYFDLDTQFNQNQIIRDFYNLLGAIKPLQDNRDLTYNHYESVIGTEFEASAYQLFLQSDQDLNNLLQAISSSYIAFNNQLLNVIGQIRNEMRKFDY
jgi:formate/nitrite transporter FocA (FNT family)